MIKHLSFIALLALAATASGQEPNELPALVVTSSGYYYIVVDDGGVPSMVEVPNVIHMDDGGSPKPPDEPDPPANPLVGKVATWAGQVDHPEGARALAVVYKTVADKVADGTISTEEAFPAVKAATEEVLPTVGDADRWDGFRQKLGDLIVDRLQSGGLGTEEEMETFLRDVAKGLGQSSGASAALDPDAITAIIELILRIISLFGGDNAGDDGGPV